MAKKNQTCKHGERLVNSQCPRWPCASKIRDAAGKCVRKPKTLKVKKPKALKHAPADEYMDFKRAKYLTEGAYGITLILKGGSNYIIKLSFLSTDSPDQPKQKTYLAPAFKHIAEIKIKEKITKLFFLSSAAFKHEVKMQDAVHKASLREFGVAICPALLFEGIFDLDAFNAEYETHRIFQLKNPPIGCRVGVAVMQYYGNIAHPSTLYKETDTAAKFNSARGQLLLAKSRRLLIMLAELGFLHGDIQRGNMVIAGNNVNLIDFGETWPISQIPGKAKWFDIIKDMGTSAILKFLYTDKNMDKEYDAANPNPGTYNSGVITMQWLRSNKFASNWDYDADIPISPEKTVIDGLKHA